MIPKWLQSENEVQYNHIDQEAPATSESKIEDSSSAEPNSRKKEKLYVTIAAYSALFVGLCTAAIVALSFSSQNFGPGRQLPAAEHCGSSYIEARARNCHFDVMSFSWLPSACYDVRLTAEFETHARWRWYSDQMGRNEVPKEEVKKGEASQLFVNMEYHRVHCTFMWKKMHRALAKGLFVDSYIGNYSHTRHCEHMLLGEDMGPGGLNTAIVTKYPKCTSHETFIE